ncbi:hypothetical protein EJ06DRAFT_463661, partial [Trichodelitschia bisporula]
QYAPGGSFAQNGGGCFLGPGGFCTYWDWVTTNRFRMAHGVLMGLAFVVFFPFGAILVRILPGPLAAFAHAGVQLFGFLFVIVGTGLGVWLSRNIFWPGFDSVGQYTNHALLQKYHPIIGLVVFGLLCFQPFLGILHHILYRRHGRRSAGSHLHIWLGRIVVTIGIINGGLGLRLAGNTYGGQIAYGVVAGVIWLVWMIAAVFGESKRAREAR